MTYRKKIEKVILRYVTDVRVVDQVHHGDGHYVEIRVVLHLFPKLSRNHVTLTMPTVGGDGSSQNY